MTLKVLFVIDGLGPGGAERSLADMLPGLTRAGITSTVSFFHRRAENLEARFRSHGARLCVVAGDGFAGRVAALRRLIAIERPDIVHTTLFESDVIARLASVGQDVVVLTSLVNTSYDPIRLQNADVSPLKLRAARLIDGWTARHLTDHFHAITAPVKSAAIRDLGIKSDRITVIERGRSGPAALPGAEARRAARQRLGLSDDQEVIVNVGRQEYQKGQRYLLEAAAGVLARRPNAVLLVAGRSGRQSPVLETIRTRLALGPRVQLLGHREDVPDLLVSADLFVFPSLYEGLGGALIEAMSLGLPIVASRIPAIEDVVEDGRNALLVERAAVQPLADAIVDLLANRPRALVFGRRSRQIFDKRFTLARSTARMAGLYQELAAGARRRAA